MVPVMDSDEPNPLSDVEGAEQWMWGFPAGSLEFAEARHHLLEKRTDFLETRLH